MLNEEYPLYWDDVPEEDRVKVIELLGKLNQVSDNHMEGNSLCEDSTSSD